MIRSSHDFATAYRSRRALGANRRRAVVAGWNAATLRRRLRAQRAARQAVAALVVCPYNDVSRPGGAAHVQDHGDGRDRHAA